MSKFRILLLTNRDSDNVGDQIIEATVISIIRGIMANLGVPEDGFSISSRAAGIISRRYMATGDPQLLEGARKAVSESDLIVFGGAPLFNYKYQNFYLRTIKTLELANEYGVPVIFSSIGVEPFDGTNPKCLALKEALALPCVRQITTRDDLVSLEKYVEGTNVQVSRVSDPAVFADIVYRKAEPPAPGRTTTRQRLGRIKGVVARRLRGRAPELPPEELTPEVKPKKIGLVVTRAGIFADNQIDFSNADQRAFWVETVELLKARGYDYRLFTTGHFSDEAFLDALVKDGLVAANKSRVIVISPDELISELKSCDGVIAYRLHASITAFAFQVPSIGLSWNFKVPYFYESVGYGSRALPPEDWEAAKVVDAMEEAIGQGVERDEAFLMSVYETLFEGFRGVIQRESAIAPFTYDELRTRLPRQAATSRAQYSEKVERKLRRSYEAYQRRYKK